MHVIDVAEHYDRRYARVPEIREPWRIIRPILAKARRFVFDKEASVFAGAFIRDFGPTLLNNLQFAIPPFECCYIEYHLDALLDTIGRRKISPEDDGARDERVGHLIDYGYVYSFVEDSKGAASFYPILINMRAETYTRGLFSSDIEDDKFKKMTYTLGSTSDDVKRTSMETMRQWLHTIDFSTPHKFRELLAQDNLRDGGNGMVRNLVALLLILNRQRERVTLTQVPPKGVIYKGKRRVYMAHSLVALTTEDYGAITRSFTPASHHESPRRHEVRGFFRHYHQVRGCDHAYVPIPAREGAWVCPKCSTVRVWVADHERGDASKGYVVKEYAVIDSKGS